MKSLIAVLALCVLACAQECPKSTELTNDDISNVDFVAEVTVMAEIGDFYQLMYDRYFDVPRRAPEQWNVIGTVKRDECKLNVGASYILGCKEGNHNCFARPSKQLTTNEKNLLQI